MMSEKCEDALGDLYTFLDGELDEAARGKIEQHLRDCSPCLEAYDFEADLRKVLANRCRDTCPDELRQRVLDAIASCDDGV